MSPYVATALDLPFGSAGGSVELFLDLYTGESPLIPARAFMLAPQTPPPRLPAGLELMTVPGKCLSGPAFQAYVDALRKDLAQRIDPAGIDVLHLQHLAFGATSALIRALPTHPRIALVHGTDLLFAEAHRDQLRVLQETARSAHAIVVPAGAMADRLLQLAPTTDRGKITKIPWGIPDHLLTNPPPRPAHRPTGHLRLLYAGRLTAEKGIEALLRAMPVAQAVELSIAAPHHHFHGLTPLLRLLKVHVRYLGWLSRPQLWHAFADHDALVMPSTTLEAMGLVALEAQACGLPVLYQPVPGLSESLAATALATDFTQPHRPGPGPQAAPLHRRPAARAPGRRPRQRRSLSPHRNGGIPERPRQTARMTRPHRNRTWTDLLTTLSTGTPHGPRSIGRPWPSPSTPTESTSSSTTASATRSTPAPSGP